jgi:hypothetical protein
MKWNKIKLENNNQLSRFKQKKEKKTKSNQNNMEILI